MEKDLITADNFDQQLDMATDFNGSQNALPIYKFDAINGLWTKYSGQKNEDGTALYEDYDKKLKAHLVNVAYRVAQSGDKSPVKVFSFETSGPEMQLIDSNDRKTIIAQGKYKDLKEKFDLRQTINAYGYVGDEPAKIKISGYASIAWYKFLNVNGNPAKYLLEFYPARRMKGLDNAPAVEATKEEVKKYEEELKAGKKPKVNLFYECLVKIAEKLAETNEGKQMVIERVNEVNDYLVKKNDQAVLTALPKEVETTAPTDAINVEEVPFDAPPPEEPPV